MPCSCICWPMAVESQCTADTPLVFTIQLEACLPSAQCDPLPPPWPCMASAATAVEQNCAQAASTAAAWPQAEGCAPPRCTIASGMHCWHAGHSSAVSITATRTPLHRHRCLRLSPFVSCHQQVAFHATARGRQSAAACASGTSSSCCPAALGLPSWLPCCCRGCCLLEKCDVRVTIHRVRGAPAVQIVAGMLGAGACTPGICMHAHGAQACAAAALLRCSHT